MADGNTVSTEPPDGRVKFEIAGTDSGGDEGPAGAATTVVNETDAVAPLLSLAE